VFADEIAAVEAASVVVPATRARFCVLEREFFIDNLLVRIHYIIGSRSTTALGFNGRCTTRTTQRTGAVVPPEPVNTGACVPLGAKMGKHLLFMMGNHLLFINLVSIQLLERLR